MGLEKNRHWYRKISDNERRTWILTDDEKNSSESIQWCGFCKILVTKSLFFSQNSKEAIKKIAVLFKDVHGEAFTVIWIAAAIIQKKKNLWHWNYDANHRNTGPLQGTHKIMHIIFLLCCEHKRSGAGQQRLCFCVHSCSATSFQDHFIQSFVVRLILKRHLLPTYGAL